MGISISMFSGGINRSCFAVVITISCFAIVILRVIIVNCTMSKAVIDTVSEAVI